MGMFNNVQKKKEEAYREKVVSAVNGCLDVFSKLDVDFFTAMDVIHSLMTTNNQNLAEHVRKLNSRIEQLETMREP